MGFQFMDFCGFQDFYGIYGSSMGLFPYFTEIIIAFGILDLGFQARFQHLRPRFQLVADPSYTLKNFMLI